ncbi:MAG: DUF6370 family protein [Planctomycetota bacterium]
MRAIWLGLAVLSLSFALFTGAEAGGEKIPKETTLKGTITCGKCDLGVTKTCATVIVTKEGGKDVVTYFDAAGHKKFHKDTCNEPKAGTVTGVVTTAKDKRTIAVSSVKYE